VHTGDALIINVSNRCNLRCRFCYEEGSRTEALPSLDAIRERFAQHPPGQLSNVMFMGAETFLRPDLVELIEAARDAGIPHVGIATNGTLLRNRTQLERLVQAGLTNLEISIHALETETAATLSGRSFTAARQRRALALLDAQAAERPLQVTINTVLCALNLSQVMPLYATIEEEFPRLQPMYHLKYPYEAADVLGRLEPARYEAIRQAQLFDRLPDTWRTRLLCEHIPLCVLAPQFELSAELAGLCLDRVMHYDLTLPEGMCTSEDFTLTRACELGPECETCSVRMLCSGLPLGYVTHLKRPGCIQPLHVPPADVLAQLTRWRRSHRLPMALALDEPATVEKVLARARRALTRRLVGPGPAETSVRAGERPDTDGPSVAVLMDEYRRSYGVLASQVTALVELHAGLRPAVEVKRSAGGDSGGRERQVRAFATRAGLQVQETPRRLLLRRVAEGGERAATSESVIAPPTCCAAVGAPRSADAISKRFGALWEGQSTHSWLMNPFLSGTPFQLYWHLPCSLSCEATRDRASALLRALATHSPRLHEHVRRVRTTPVLYTDAGGRAFLFMGSLRGHTIHYREVFAGRAHLPRERALRPSIQTKLQDDLARALAEGDGLTLLGPQLTIRAGRRVVARFSQPPRQRWMLHDFI